MKIHHLNLCTMCPFGGRLVSAARRSILEAGELVVHALVVETAKDGLVLVETGMGVEDTRRPLARLGAGFVALSRPVLREEQTALRQIERLGFQKGDVRHVVVTHLDPDHAGGLPDFPHAAVHVHKDEHEAAMRPTLRERQRYRRAHFRHGPRWELHAEGGDRWLGFESVRAVGEDVLLVPLRGHTRGHSAVAVRAPEGTGFEWLLHCGDAYFFHGELVDPRSCPGGLAAFQRFMAVDDEQRRANAARLRALHREEGSRVKIFSAHSPEELRAFEAARDAAE